MYNESIGLNPGNRIRFEEFEVVNSGRICELHFHDEIELLLIRSGRISCVVDDREYCAEAGGLLFIGGSVPHYTISRSEHSRYTLLQFRIDDYWKSSNLPDLPVLRQVARAAALSISDPRIADAMEAIRIESSEREQGFNLMIRSSVYQIIARLVRDGALRNPDGEVDSAAVGKLRPVFDFVEKNFASPITLEDAAATLGLNPSYFCRIFRTVTGLTFTEYLSSVRIARSKQLLQTTSESITDISMDVGFASVNYFNRIFKKTVNCTPTVYRRLRYRNI